MATDTVRKARGPRFDATVLGHNGVRHSAGVVAEEYLRELRGSGAAARTFRDMADNDPTVGAVLFAISMLVRSVEWTVQAADDTDAAEEAKAFVEEVLDDMSTSWSAVVSEVCTMFTYGWAALEIVWKRRIGPDEADGARRSRFRDGRVGVRALALRGQGSLLRWELQPDGGIAGMVQALPGGGEAAIPIGKLLLFRTAEERNNPEGRSLLRAAYRPWYFKKRIEEIEAVGIERDLAGLPVGYVPGAFFDPDASPEEKAVLARWQEMISRIRNDTQAGVLLPSDRDPSGNLLFDVKLLTSGGSRAFDTSGVVDRKNREIATSVLADFLFLGQQAVGSFALSSDKTALFATALGAFTKAVAEVFNRHLLPRLWALNGMDEAVMPTINPGDLERRPVAETIEGVLKMVQAGAAMLPDRELENALRKQLGLPEAPEDGPVLPDQGVPGGGPGGGPGGVPGDEPFIESEAEAA